eukprot:2692133-Rhodomonas_salina.1
MKSRSFSLHAATKHTRAAAIQHRGIALTYRGASSFQGPPLAPARCEASCAGQPAPLLYRVPCASAPLQNPLFELQLWSVVAELKADTLTVSPKAKPRVGSGQKAEAVL